MQTSQPINWIDTSLNKVRVFVAIFQPYLFSSGRSSITVKYEYFSVLNERPDESPNKAEALSLRVCGKPFANKLKLHEP